MLERLVVPCVVHRYPVPSHDAGEPLIEQPLLQAFASFMREEDERWASVIAKNKITLD